MAQNKELRNIIHSNAVGIALEQEKVDQYVKAMSLTGTEKENYEKLASMWMYATQMGSLPPSSVRKITPPSRPVMLIPARAGSTSMVATPPPPPAPMLVSPPMLYRGMPMPPTPALYACHHPSTLSIPGSYRTQKSVRSAADIQSQRRQRRRAAAQCNRTGKMDANRRQRRKSDADVIDGQTFQYTGLDRAIADSFLAQQEQSNPGSHIDYSSSSSASETYANGQRAPQFASSRASSKTKIVCRDVVM